MFVFGGDVTQPLVQRFFTVARFSEAITRKLFAADAIASAYWLYTGSDRRELRARMRERFDGFIRARRCGVDCTIQVIRYLVAPDQTVRVGLDVDETIVTGSILCAFAGVQGASIEVACLANELETWFAADPEPGVVACGARVMHIRMGTAPGTTLVQ